MKLMKNKFSWLTAIAVATTMMAALAAVLAYLKKKSKMLSDELDLDDVDYFDDGMEDTADEKVSAVDVESVEIHE